MSFIEDIGLSSRLSRPVSKKITIFSYFFIFGMNMTNREAKIIQSLLCRYNILYTDGGGGFPQYSIFFYEVAFRRAGMQ
jgi:hypothetical protein